MKFIDIKSNFYKEVLDAWSILCKETSRENYLWNNKCIKIANKPVFFKDFAENIKQLYDDDEKLIHFADTGLSTKQYLKVEECKSHVLIRTLSFFSKWKR